MKKGDLNVMASMNLKRLDRVAFTAVQRPLYFNQQSAKVW